MREKVVSKPEKRVLMLMGLGCASCAARIEKEIKSLPGVKSASLDFASRRLTIEAATQGEMDYISQKAVEIVERIEKGVKIAEETDEESMQDMPVDKKRITRIGAGAVLFLVASIFSLP